MQKAFPDGTLSTLLFDPDQTFPEFRGHDIRTSKLNRVPWFRRDPRRALPFLGHAARRLRLPECDVALISTSGWAHGFKSDAPKVVYCHNTPRWIYQPDEYLDGMPWYAALAAKSLAGSLRAADLQAAASADVYLANSTAVARRIRSAYGIEARVLHPPSSLDVAAVQTRIDGLEPGFWLTVSRARGYKNTDVVVAAFDQCPGERLVVVGRSEQSDRAQGVGRVSDAELRWLYANCRGLISASYEDFGLTPIEANAYGKPVLALRAGGFLDTVLEGVNGSFFDEVTPDAVRRAVEAFEGFDEAAVRRHAENFSEGRFIHRLTEILAEVAGR